MKTPKELLDNLDKLHEPSDFTYDTPQIKPTPKKGSTSKEYGMGLQQRFGRKVWTKKKHK